MYVDGGGHYESVLFMRCAPGEKNPLDAVYAEGPPEIRGCAPTIDELKNETVRISVTQLGRRGPTGIWVVDRLEIPQSAGPGNIWLLDPDYLDPGQGVEQRVPPSDTEVTALLEAFLRARVEGADAEQYLLREPEEIYSSSEKVPLLYATTSGAPYQRSEIQRMQGPVWPNGRMEYKVRLFAEDRTVVEQYFHVVRLENGRLGLLYGYDYDNLPTTENGQSVPVPFSLLDGEVTFAAAPPWRTGPASNASDTYMRLQAAPEEHIVIGTDPLPGCENVSAPADAEALAPMIMADPNSATTGTVPVRIAGLDGLQMDVDVDDYSCWQLWGPDQLDRWRTRLYLIDYPGEPAQVLAIAVIAPEESFESVVEKATPIVESLEIHTG